MNNWTVKTIPHHPRRRWYALHWNGAPLSYLKDGRTMGAYKYRKLAQYRADELNMGAFAARVKHDPSLGYTVGAVGPAPGGFYVAINGTWIASDLHDETCAWQVAGEHYADAQGISANNPNRRPQA